MDRNPLTRQSEALEARRPIAVKAQTGSASGASVGAMVSGEFQPAGISNVTSTADGFYSAAG